LKQAIPESPEIFSMVRDIKNGASESGIIINDLDISDVTLKQGKSTGPNSNSAKKVKVEAGDENKKYTVRFTVASNFNEVKNFIQKLMDQRRMKIIEQLDIVTGGQQGSQSATFNVSFVVDGYYL
jgi:hypothetical protein